MSSGISSRSDEADGGKVGVEGMIRPSASWETGMIRVASSKIRRGVAASVGSVSQTAIKRSVGVSRLQGVGARTVHVLVEMDGNGAELVEIEPGVPGLEGVEGPGDAGDLSRGPPPLGGLEQVAESSPLMAGRNAGELRVKAEPAVDLAEKRKRHPDGLSAWQERPSTSPPWCWAPIIVATGTM